MTYQPHSMTWEERCAQLSKWVEINGRVPSQLSEDATERSCYSWLTSNRMNLKAGKLTAEQQRLFRALPVPEVSRNSMADRIDELERFYTTHGRLPLTTAVDLEEKSLSSFLVANLRAKIKKGTLGRRLLRRAEVIPGVVEFTLVPDQEQTLEELSDYAARHGHMPPYGRSGNAQEYRLSNWIRNNTHGKPEDKSPALRSRHEAILVLMERYPGAADFAFGRRLPDLEAFVEARGHLPSSTKARDTESKRLASSVAAFRRELDEGELSPEEEIRVKAVLAYPSVVDYEWQSNLKGLAHYAAAHDGRLPGTWAEGKVFSWLTIQRRQYKKGLMSQERLEKLLAIDGVIPSRTKIQET